MSRRPSIDLNLRRIARLRLFDDHPDGFRAVHVAGTNGKGTICHAISRMLTHAGVRWGRFTSPFMLHQADAVVVNDTPLSREAWSAHASALGRVFMGRTSNMVDRKERMERELIELKRGEHSGRLAHGAVLEAIQTRKKLLKQGINMFGKVSASDRLSDFELQTAVALREFGSNPDVDVGVVEVGMGGTGDATNIMPPQTKLVSVISHIGLDHTEYLGTDVVKVALAKAGIMVRDTPVVIDGRNEKRVLDTIVAHASHVGAPFVVTLNRSQQPPNIAKMMGLLEGLGRGMGLQPHVVDNLWCAYLATRLALDRLRIMDWEAYHSHKEMTQILRDVVETALPPGRLQFLDLPKRFHRAGGSPTEAPRPIIVDGAHNVLGASALGRPLAALRSSRDPVVWIFALSDSPEKDPVAFMRHLPLLPIDSFAAVRFKPAGASDPVPMEPRRLLSAIEDVVLKLRPGAVYEFEPRMSEDLLRWAVERAAGGMIVVTGSLYMLRDLFRITGLPPPPPRVIREGRSPNSPEGTFGSLRDLRDVQMQEKPPSLDRGVSERVPVPDDQ